MPIYNAHWYHTLLASALDEVLTGKIRRLMVNIPPQTGKSELVTRRLAAYALGRNPELKILSGSHSAGLAEQMNHDVKNIIDDERYRTLFPGTRLAAKGGRYKRTAEYFEIEGHRGSLRSAGAGVKVAGHSAELGIIDDPLGSREDANSPAIREKVWNWIISDFMSRLPKWAPIVLCQTRWHPDDPAGRFQVRMANGDGDRWTIISLPALFTGTKTHQSDPRTQKDEALWPRHQDTASLLKLRELNPRDFSALYQQDPMAAGSEWPREWFGSDVWFDEWPDANEGVKVVALDASKGIGAMGDYSAFVKIMYHKGLFYVDADMANDRNIHDIGQRALQIQKEFNPRLFGAETELQNENVEQGRDPVLELLSKYAQEANVRLPLVAVRHGGIRKEVRIQRLTDWLASKAFRFKTGSVGARLLVQQLMEFPNGEHDDAPDALEVGMRIFLETGVGLQ